MLLYLRVIIPYRVKKMLTPFPNVRWEVLTTYECEWIVKIFLNYCQIKKKRLREGRLFETQHLPNYRHVILPSSFYYVHPDSDTNSCIIITVATAQLEASKQLNQYLIIKLKRNAFFTSLTVHSNFPLPYGTYRTKYPKEIPHVCLGGAFSQWFRCCAFARIFFFSHNVDIAWTME